MHYVSGKDGQDRTAKKFGVSRTQLCRWIHAWQFHGDAGLKILKQRSYTPEFKLKVVRHALQLTETTATTAARFNIPSFSSVEAWLKLYREKGASAFLTYRGPKSTMQKKPSIKVSPDAVASGDVQKELRYLRAENAYLKSLQEWYLEKKPPTPEKKRE